MPMLVYIYQTLPRFQCTKKMNNWISGKVYLVACSSLLVVCNCLLVVCGRSLVVYGRCLVVCGGF